MLDRGITADRVAHGMRSHERQLGPPGDRRRRIQRDGEHQRGVDPGAPEPPATLGLALGERHCAMRCGGREHPLRRLRLGRPVVLAAVCAAQRGKHHGGFEQHED